MSHLRAVPPAPKIECEIVVVMPNGEEVPYRPELLDNERQKQAA